MGRKRTPDLPGIAERAACLVKSGLPVCVMIDLKLLRTTKLADLQPEELFCSIGGDGTCHFLAGTLNEFEIRVALNGEKPFEFAEKAEWDRAPGVAVKGIRFEVDYREAVAADSYGNVPTGSLIVMGDGLAIQAAQNLERRPIALSGANPGRQVERGDIAFPAWRIVIGSKADPEVLYEKACAGSVEVPHR